MDPFWESEFQARMRSFELRHPPAEGEVSVSLKVRVTSGCFHAEHSPRAYALIDKHLTSISPSRFEFVFVKHESGPEIVLYLALATAGITLAKSVIDLIVVIIKARSEGVKSGDRPNDPLEIIVRRVDVGDRFIEEKVMRICHDETIKRADIEAQITAALKRLAAESGTKTAKPRLKGRRRKRRTP